MFLKIISEYGFLVAEINGKIVGYEMLLSAGLACSDDILKVLYDRALQHNYKGKNIAELKTVIEGQICVAKEHKVKGIVEALHKQYLKILHERGVELIVTEVSDLNPRSYHVHKKTRIFSPRRVFRR